MKGGALVALLDTAEHFRPFLFMTVPVIRLGEG